ASTYLNKDLGDDIVMPGAFTKTLASRSSVPLLWDHKTAIGLITATDSDRGLAAAGEINLEKEIGQEVYSDLKFYHDRNEPMGLSIGFQVIRQKDDGQTRQLLELKLHEISLTLLPMNQQARVTTVKSAQRDAFARAAEDLRRFYQNLKK